MKNLPRDRETWVALTNQFSDPEIARQFRVGNTAILYWRKKHGIKAKHALKRKRTYAVDEDFFSNISTEAQSYILGFICGDGNIHTRMRSVSISVNPLDIDILEKTKTAMKSAHPIKITDNSRGFSATGKVAILDIGSKKIASSLIHLGVGPNKTFHLHYPDIPRHLDCHFIRGILDSDGWVRQYQFGFCGAAQFINTIRTRISEDLGNILYKSDKGKFAYLIGNGKDRNVIHWLYGNPSIFLDRKHSLYLEYWK